MFEIHDQILKSSGAKAIVSTELVQTLWSGYGEIKRYVLKGGKYPSVIVKHIQLPETKDHPKGWNTPTSHQRKLTSYQVERNWYQNYAQQTDINCRVPQCLHAIEKDDELLLIMEDLDARGYHIRLGQDIITIDSAKNCLSWLAHFHAKFMGVAPEGLWQVGTYWHLDTRPDELSRMENMELKHAAQSIDKLLKNATYQTLVHGDAKLANFCFSDTGSVAAVDFQYVGKGCGVKDVAYFLSSCFDEETCEKYEEELLSYYFNKLEEALSNAFEIQSIKKEWSKLYRYAWADFYRFLNGWSPGHWKMHGYSKQLTQQVIKELKVQ